MKKIANFLKDVKTELGKVVWPTKAQTARHTWFVIASIVAAMVIIGFLDYGLASLVKIIFLGE